ncbi:MAG: CRISPR-associated protein Csc3 [Cyanophyceae cyanobacterium]
MLKHRNIFQGEPKTLEEQYFSEIRPNLYGLHGTHAQYGTRKGRSLAEHLDSACQFVLSVSKIAQVPEPKRPLILAATAVHDLNKFDEDGRSVKTLARDRSFLQAQLERACVAQFVQTEEDLELVRRLVERHSGHNSSDGMRFLPEDPNIGRWAAMLVGGDLFDLGIEESERIRKVETELTVALQRDTHLFKVSLSEDRGYFTSLLLSACEEVLGDRGLQTLAIEPDGQIFVGEAFPEEVTLEIAQQWLKKIEGVFSSNVEQLVRATKDGIKIDSQAIQQNREATLNQVNALLVKKANGYKADKVARDIQKYGEEAGEAAVASATIVGLSPVSSAEEFAVSEGLKAAYLSYRAAGLSTSEVWDCIANQVQLSPEQRLALEPFNPQYGRCLFAATATGGLESVYAALNHSFQLRQTKAEVEVPPELVHAVEQLLNFPHASRWQGSELTAYIEAKPDERCSLGTTSPKIEKLISNKMPPGTKVQAFSNRLPGGMSAEPKRRADALAALSYQLLAVAANFPKASKQDPLYLHFALPKGSNPALQKIWQQFLQRTAQTNEDGPVTVDELQLYREYKMVFKANKVVGIALPKRPELIRSTVTIPVVWGDINSSVALLKSLRLALELALALDFGFPFVLSGSLEVEPAWDRFGRVEGIPSSLQPLLGTGQYQREGHLSKQERSNVVTAEAALTRLQCVGKLAITVASLPKKDDCLYDLARAATRPLELYYVLLRWVLREQDDPNLEAVWTRIKEPLNTLLESLMAQEHDQISSYLKQAAHIAEVGKLRGSSFRITARSYAVGERVNQGKAK